MISKVANEALCPEFKRYSSELIVKERRLTVKMTTSKDKLEEKKAFAVASPGPNIERKHIESAFYCHNSN